MGYDDAPLTKGDFDNQMTRLVNHYHPGRNVEDFTEWASEIRRAFGHVSGDVVRAAIPLWKLKEDRLPIISKFKPYLDEAARQVDMERTKRLPPPKAPPGTTYRKPPVEVLEDALCLGIARTRLAQDGRADEVPSDEDVRAVFMERREANVPLGKMPGIGVLQPRWKEAEQIIHARRLAGTLSPRLEEYLLDRAEEDRTA